MLLKRELQCFASKTLENDPVGSEIQFQRFLREVFEYYKMFPSLEDWKRSTANK